MRIVGSALVLLGLVLLGLVLLDLGACTPTTSPDEECITQGGVCFTSMDLPACGSPIMGSGLCSSGFTCCTVVDPYNILNGKTFDAGPPPSFVDAGDADVVSDATPDSSVDALHDAVEAAAD